MFCTPKFGQFLVAGFLCVAFAQVSSLAQDRGSVSGGGGRGVQCRDEAGQPESLEVLDLAVTPQYLSAPERSDVQIQKAFDRYRALAIKFDRQSWAKKCDLKLDHDCVAQQAIAETYIELIQGSLKHVHEIFEAVPRHFELELTHDIGASLPLKSNCSPVQIGIYFDTQDRLYADLDFFGDPKVVNSGPNENRKILNETQRAGFYLHEAIYALARSRAEPGQVVDSEKTRIAVRDLLDPSTPDSRLLVSVYQAIGTKVYYDGSVESYEAADRLIAEMNSKKSAEWMKFSENPVRCRDPKSCTFTDIEGDYALLEKKSAADCRTTMTIAVDPSGRKIEILGNSTGFTVRSGVTVRTTSMDEPMRFDMDQSINHIYRTMPQSRGAWTSRYGKTSRQVKLLGDAIQLHTKYYLYRLLLPRQPLFGHKFGNRQVFTPTPEGLLRRDYFVKEMGSGERSDGSCFYSRRIVSGN